ncbi:MAG: hypothetical protein JSW66_06300 [Phycisphaerales bacterium]|nr:MAG: hypothetical protein JSW66_06300 [Phycisphaerales bacterium]
MRQLELSCPTIEETLFVFLYELLETGIFAQGLPGRVKAKQWNRHFSRGRKQKLKLVDGRIKIANHHIDPG